MMTSSNGNIFRVTGPLCGEFTGLRWKRPVTRSFNVFFDLCLNKRLSKQSWGWWFEMQSRPLWRHRKHHDTIIQTLWLACIYRFWFWNRTGSGKWRIQVPSLLSRWKSQSKIKIMLRHDNDYILVLSSEYDVVISWKSSNTFYMAALQK